MLIASEARYITLNRNVVGRIGEDELGLLSTHQFIVAVGLQGVATEQKIFLDRPNKLMSPAIASNVYFPTIRH